MSSLHDIVTSGFVTGFPGPYDPFPFFKSTNQVPASFPEKKDSF